MPEVVQTSAMDCGPACLTALLRGFGVEVSYGRLREACQTDVDGTSIDTLEEIATRLGLDAVQMLIPVDHVLRPEADALPALAIVRTPGGDNHFVVAWGQAMGRVQVMDPSLGRRWVPRHEFLDELYVHEMQLPATAWREWAGSDDLREPLAGRMRDLGVAAPARLIDAALDHDAWEPIAALDAATRMVQAMIDAGGVRAGAEGAVMVTTLAAAPDSIPEPFWSARATDDPESVRARGTVMLRVSGRKQVVLPDSPELAAALTEAPPRPWRAIGEALTADGSAKLAAIGVGLAIAAAGTVGETILFRGLFDLGRELSTMPQQLGAMAAVLAVLIALLLVEVPLRAGTLRLGRHVEARLRLRFLAKLPRLGLAYLRSRPRSDMAERSHMLHQLRELPPLGGRIARLCGEIVVTAAALCWLAPASAPVVAILVVVAIAPPFAVQPLLAERDLQLRTHAGSLSRFYFDALQGATPARTHGFERTLQREHEALLVAWIRAAREERRLSVAVNVVQSAIGIAAAVALVASFANRGGEPASVLLLAFWALAIPLAGQELTAVLRAVPGKRNTTLRLLEPLQALDVEVDAALPTSAAAAARGPATFAMRGLAVRAAGHTILEDVNVEIAAGEHVAIVGRSGAGKSSLLGVLLGWVRPSAGELVVDGAIADAVAIARLRQETAWVDPAIHLWNDTLAENLTYGARGADVATVIGAADLEPVMARLPEGLATRLGEGGGLVSGGEGQRVRLGRALARRAPRLVLLDEPCRGLDRAMRTSRLTAARRQWRDATLLCVMHDVAETAAFDRVIVVDGGRIVEDGAPSELAAQPDSRYAALLADEVSVERTWTRWKRLVLHEGRVGTRNDEEARP